MADAREVMNIRQAFAGSGRGPGHTVKRGGDEQDCIGAMSAGLDNLVLVHHEILAQAGQGAAGEASSRLRRLP